MNFLIELFVFSFIQTMHNVEIIRLWSERKSPKFLYYLSFRLRIFQNDQYLSVLTNYAIII